MAVVNQPHLYLELGDCGNPCEGASRHCGACGRSHLTLFVRSAPRSCEAEDVVLPAIEDSVDGIALFDTPVSRACCDRFLWKSPKFG